jgi:serine protease Do/serine protease DegQ
VVVAINGRPVKGSLDLRNQLGLVPLGESADITVQREGRERTVRAMLEPVKPRAARGDAIPELAGAAVVDTGRRSGARTDGVGVVTVEYGSAAWNQGLRPGDVIVGVNRRQVGSVRELMSALQASDRSAALNVVRGEVLLTLAIRR